jgi:hypothetical protein
MDEAMDKGKASATDKGGKKTVTPKPYQRPRGGDAKAVSALMLCAKLCG